MEKITLIPAEKAKQLEGRYFHTIFMRGGNLVNETIIKNLSKLCATMAVDEIKEQIIKNLSNDVSTIHAIYWEKVKQEIKKL
jgi:hypothetical protein